MMLGTPRALTQCRKLLEDIVPGAAPIDKGTDTAFTLVERGGYIYKVSVQKMNNEIQQTFRARRGLR